MDNCIFCKIVKGDIPSSVIYEDENVKVILDIAPAAKGHAILLVKEHVANVFELPADLAAKVFAVVPKVAAAIKSAFPCIKVGQAVIGLEVPHAHIHLIPIQKESDMLFSNEKLKLTAEEFKEIAEKISNAL